MVMLRSGQADVVVGSRYVAGGDLGEWDRTRASMSDLATRVSRLVLRADVTSHDVLRLVHGITMATEQSPQDTDRLLAVMFDGLRAR